jgi:hypothetical protein
LSRLIAYPVYFQIVAQKHRGGTGSESESQTSKHEATERWA